MPDEFTPEEQELLAEAPADAATFIGEGEPSAEDERAARGTAPEPPAEGPPVPQG